MLKPHPIAKLFPAMTEEEFEFTKADMKRHGLKDPILLLDSLVLDGGHRYRICRALGIKPRLRTLRKGADALAAVISRNLARRQLSAGQRYGVLLRIAQEHPEVQARLDAIKENTSKRQRDGRPLPQPRQRSSEAIGRLAPGRSVTAWEAAALHSAR